MTAMTTEWQPGDPLYPVEHTGMSYPSTLSDCCPSGCWCRVIERGGYAMRWTPDEPILRFLPDGLHATEPSTNTVAHIYGVRVAFIQAAKPDEQPAWRVHQYETGALLGLVRMLGFDNGGNEVWEAINPSSPLGDYRCRSRLGAAGALVKAMRGAAA